MTLAVSLHAATDDELRNQLVPLNRRYPIARGARRRRRLRRRQGPAGHVRVRLHRGGQRLARPGRGARAACSGAFPGVGGAHVNLIPLNPTAGFDGRAPRRVRRCGPSPSGSRAHGVDGDGAPQPGHRHRRRLRPAALPGGDTRRAAADRPQWNREHIGSGSISSSPRPSYIATILCYIDAVFGLLFGVFADLGARALVVIVALGAGGFGIANEKRWGYAVAVVGAVLQVADAGRSCSASSVLTSHGDHQPAVRRRARRAAPAPHEPRVPAHLVQVAAARVRRGTGGRRRCDDPPSGHPSSSHAVAAPWWRRRRQDLRGSEDPRTRRAAEPHTDASASNLPIDRGSMIASGERA